MSTMSWLFTNGTEPRPTSAGELINASQARRAVEEEERAQLRRSRLLEQRSDVNPPDVRIRAWEKLHGLRLPSKPGHPVLAVIAADTHLSSGEVQAEQRARREQRVLRANAAAGHTPPKA